MGQQVSSGEGGSGASLEACGCVNRGGLQEHVYLGDAPEKSRDDEFDRATSSCLVFPRHRIFRPHTRAKLRDHYLQEKMLGQGSHGKVYKAFVTEPGQGAINWLSPRGVAVKHFALGSGQSRHDQHNRRATKQSFEREREMLAQLEHPHIIKMYEAFEEREHLFIVMEVCQGGELYEYIAQRVREGHGGVTEAQAVLFFRQMLYAISYMHAKNLMHRDLKTENFLLLGSNDTQDASLRDVVKLCDFGSATLLSHPQQRAMEVIGTLSYTAPEVYREKGAVCAADNWSLGACLYVLLVGASPFRVTGEEPQKEIIARICNGEFERSRPRWTELSREAQDMIQSLLVVDERRRVSSSSALKHPWVDAGAGAARKGHRAGQDETRSQSPQSKPRGKKKGQDDRYSELSRYSSALFQFLSRFSSLDMVQRIVLNLCAALTPEAEVIDNALMPWYDIFVRFDRDMDGRCSREELLTGLSSLPGPGYSDDELEGIIDSIDIDGSGYVEWVEWVAVSLLSSEGIMKSWEPLHTAFRLLDRPSGDGRVGSVDLLALLEARGAGALSSLDGREQANRLIARWASRQPDQRSNGRAGIELCLFFDDLRALLEEAVVDPGDGVTEDGGEWRTGQAISLLCCRAEDPLAGCESITAGPLLPLLPLLREQTFGTEVSDNASAHQYA